MLDRLGPHEGGEVGRSQCVLRGVRVSAEVVNQEAEGDVVGLELVLLEVAERIPRVSPHRDVVVERLADVGNFAVSQFAGLALDVGLGLFGFELREIGFEFLLALGNFLVTNLLEVADFRLHALLDHRQVLVDRLVVDARHHVGGEVDDLFEVLRRHVEEVSEATRNTLEVPDVGNRCGEFDVAHALTSNGLAGYLNTASLTGDTLEADTLVLATGAFPVLRRTKDLFSEQTVLLGLEGAVVDGFGLLHFTARP